MLTCTSSTTAACLDILTLFTNTFINTKPALKILKTNIFCENLRYVYSAVTSRRLIVTSYNVAITRFLYPATNNRDRVFTGSNHHVFMKIPVLETPNILHLCYEVVCLFVSVQIMVFRHLLMHLCQFVPTSNSLQTNN